MKSELALPPIIVCDRNIWKGTQVELDQAAKITEWKFWQPEGAPLYNQLLHEGKVALN